MADPFSSWGAEESGARIGQIDQERTLATQIKGIHDLGVISGQPDVNRKARADADKAELEVANQKRFQEMMTRRQQQLSETASSPNSANRVQQMANSAADMADMAAGAGMMDMADKGYRAAGYLFRQDAQIDNARTLAKLNTLKAQHEDARMISSLVAGVTDQQSWDRANALYMFQTGQPSPYASIPYSPELTKQVRDAAIKAEDQIRLKMIAEDNASKDSNRKSAETLRATRERLLKQAADLAQRREDRLAKQGDGKAVGATPKADMDQALRLIKKGQPGLGEDVSTITEAAANIASEAQTILRRNPALDRAQAVQQAYNAAVIRGDFKNTVDKGIFRDTQKTSYERQAEGVGKTPDSPIAAKGLPVTSYVVGNYYSNPQGQVGKWTGTGFVPAGRTERALPANNARVGAAVPADIEDDNAGEDNE